MDTYSPQPGFSQRVQHTPEQPISYLIASVAGNPNLISLAAGLVDEPTLPCKDVQRLANDLLSNPAAARAAMQYSTTRGLPPLREALLAHLEKLEGMSAKDMNLVPNDVLVTSGSQQVLYLTCEALLNPGDIVIAERPSYFVYTGALTSFQARVVGIDMDDDGMKPDELEAALQRLDQAGELERVKLVYCTSYFQNPTGLSLSAERRPQVLDIVKRYSRKHRIMLVEDAAYRELSYDALSPRSIKSYDADNEYVILTQTFSKPFAPGLRVGYGFMPSQVEEVLLNFKSNHDFGSAHFSQHVMLRALQDGTYARQVDRLCENYREKRQIMLDALEQHMPKSDDIHWTRPGGGLYVWLTLPASIDTSRDGELFKRCLDTGVLYVPGEYCYAEESGDSVPQNHLRLCYGHVVTDQIAPGIERLAQAVRELLAPAAVQPA